MVIKASLFLQNRSITMNFVGNVLRSFIDLFFAAAAARRWAAEGAKTRRSIEIHEFTLQVLVLIFGNL